MGGCCSKLSLVDGAGEHYQKQWPQMGRGENLGPGAGYGGLGASAPAAAPAYTTTANVGLGRGEERRVFLDGPCGLQLPRIEEDQALQGQESPTKSQLSAAPSGANLGAGGVAAGAGDKAPPRPPPNWTRGELIGQGAFGSVYLGMDNDSGQLMAVKQVHLSKAAERGKVSEHIRELEAEVHLLQQLCHPNIVRYLGTERTDAALNIFLEYVPGGSIASLLAKFGSFRESVIKVYTKQILLGLEYLHTHGIMHRDIKGANILVDNTGLVKLADFGASKKIEDLVTIDSGFKSVKGTPYWMAPEVITQTGHGRQADIWSVACTVIEMATGKPPWSQFGSQVSAMFHIASSKGPPIIPENLSADCKDFLYLCFNRSWKDRPSASRLLQHPFLAEVVCRTVAAPLNNIANVVQEPSIKAWRVPKSVRVPSPMREDSEGTAPFSTPSPMHPRAAERAAAGGAARISTATSQGARAEGEQGTPRAAADLPHTPLAAAQAGVEASRRGEFAGTPRSRQQQPVLAHPQQQAAALQQRSPSKLAGAPLRPSLRSSAPVLRGYASVALSGAPLPPERQEKQHPALGNSAASSVRPRGPASADLQQQRQDGGVRLSREASLGGGSNDAALRTSGSGSLRGSREIAAAPAAAAGVAGAAGGMRSSGSGSSLRVVENEAFDGSLGEAETPVPTRRGAGTVAAVTGGRGGERGPAPGGPEASTPSTGDSRGTCKSDYNPMEEPSWMQHSQSPVVEGATAAADGSPAIQPTPRGRLQQEPSASHGMPRRPSVAVPPTAEPGEQRAAHPEQQQQQHMVWLDDDGSIDALPWDMGSWSVGSGEPSPSGDAPAAPVGSGAEVLPPQLAGEPVGQEVLMSALNRRAHMEVRASLALFESTLKSLNVPKENSPSPASAEKRQPPVMQAAASALGGPAVIAGTPLGARLAAAARASKEDLAALAQPLGAFGAPGGADKRQPLAIVAAAPAFPLPGMQEDAGAAFGGREAVWEQELSKELSQFGQLPSQWRYAGSRRMSMHGSPQKAPLA